MERISPDELKIMLERRWRQIAPKRLVKEMDEKALAPAKAPAKRLKSRREAR
jgi:hypothetical protein